jgi:hypothetical protein
MRALREEQRRLLGWWSSGHRVFSDRLEESMNRPNGPPRLLFVHEWWLELRDDLKLAGALFYCFPDRDPQMPNEVRHTMFDRAEAPGRPRSHSHASYGGAHDARLLAARSLTLGPVLNDEWLAPLRDGFATSNDTGLVQIIRVERTGDDRKSDPEL